MNASAYRKQFQEVFSQLDALEKKLSSHTYLKREELDRDVSALAECHQKYIDISGEIINDEDVQYGR